MRRINKLTWFLLGLLLLFIVAGLVGPVLKERNRVQTTKVNLHELQLAVERYKDDEPSGLRSYPKNIQQAIDLGCIAAMPINPYTGKPMVNIGLGEPVSPGNFTYLPQEETAAPGISFADYYLLVGYSTKGIHYERSTQAQKMFEEYFKEASQLDWRKVCLVLQADTDYRGDILKVRDEKRREFIDKHKQTGNAHKPPAHE